MFEKASSSELAFFCKYSKPPARPAVPFSLLAFLPRQTRNPLATIEMRSANCKQKNQRNSIEKSNNHTLAHTTWNCKYHIVFAPKFRRKVFYGDKRREIGEILRTLCGWKQVNIVEAEVCPDHVHMLVEIPPKYSVSGFMGFLKGKSSLMIYERYPALQYKYRNREFWCRGYYVDTAGKSATKIAAYSKNQLDEDKYGEQLTMLGKMWPVYGRPVRTLRKWRIDQRDVTRG